MDRYAAVRGVLADLHPGFDARVQTSLDRIYVELGNRGPIGRSDIAEHLWEKHAGYLRPYIPLLMETVESVSQNGENIAAVGVSHNLYESGMQALLHAIVAFSKQRAALFAMSGLEFADFYRKHLCENSRKREELASKLDAERFFSFPEADADLSYWREMPSWSVEEATALSFGKEPNIVTAQSLHDDKVEGPSIFAPAFHKRLQKLQRAISVNQLTGSAPKTYIDWFTKEGMGCQLSSSQHDTSDDVLKMKTEIAILRSKLSAYESDIEDINPKSRYSLYKMVIIMAKHRYNHRLVGNTTATARIAKAYEEEKTLAMSVDTVKGWLSKIANDPAMSDVISALRQMEMKESV